MLLHNIIHSLQFTAIHYNLSRYLVMLLAGLIELIMQLIILIVR